MEIYQRQPGLCYHNTGNEEADERTQQSPDQKEIFAEIKNSATLVPHEFCLGKYTYFSFGNLEILMIKVIRLFFVIFKGIHKYFSKVLALNSKSGIIDRFNQHKQ